MFEQYYGLTEKPFNLTPDTDFFYQSLSHQEALNVLLLAIQSGEGFIKVTGEVGTGKTLLCRKLLEQLDGIYNTVYIPNPYMDKDALFQAIVDELELEATDSSQYLKIINKQLLKSAEKGEQTVLLLDEAQSIPEESLEAIRLLSNLETEKQKLIQIILIGQPELNDKLNQSSIRQLQQRIMHSYELMPLSEDSMGLYLNCRLKRAGYCGPALFSKAALAQLFSASQGVPRLINVLANKSLLSAYGKGDYYVDPKHVKAAIKDSEFISNASRKNRWLSILSISFFVLLLIALWLKVQP